MNLRRLLHRIGGHGWQESHWLEIQGERTTRYSCSCGHYGLQRGDFGRITDMGR